MTSDNAIDTKKEKLKLDFDCILRVNVWERRAIICNFSDEIKEQLCKHSELRNLRRLSTHKKNFVPHCPEALRYAKV